MENTSNQRLESLDILRGFDLFCLVALEGIVHPLGRAFNSPVFNNFLWGFTHKQWEGFSTWDLVMPLFMFMAGVSMPFALSKYKQTGVGRNVYWRIAKRVLLLWIFGMMCQGNLLGLDPHRIYLYSNTLQAIATGYLFSALLFLNTKWKTRLIVSAALLLAYWGGMQFITVDGYGGGNYTPDGNLAEWIDRTILGRFRDAASVSDGEIVFAPYYRYTWIFSSMTFVVTVMSGVFAGEILKSGIDKKKKWQYLLIIGISCVLLGWIWNFNLPVIKKIWTSSMVLVSSGYCFILMGLFYYWIDYKGRHRNLTWLKVYGMNSITAYMLANIISFGCIGSSLFHGLEQYIGNYYPVLMAATNAVIIYLILQQMYRHKIFLKV